MVRYQSENASTWWPTYGLAKMELDAEVQLDEAVVTHFPILGIRGMMISHESSTSEIPRANYTNMAAFGMIPSGGLAFNSFNISQRFFRVPS